MTTIVLVIHLIIALALVGLILLQRNEGGGMGLGGGGNMGGLMTTRGTANLLTRSTAILATAFVCTSLLLAVLGSRERSGRSILDTVAPVDAPAASAPAGAPTAGDTPAAAAPPETTPSEPATPAAPAAPVAQ